MKKLFLAFIGMGIILSGMTGCTTKKYVNSRIDDALNAEINAIRNEIDTTRSGVEKVEKEVIDIRKEIEVNQAEITNEITRLKDMTAKQKEELMEREKTIIQEAMARAEQTGKLKERKLLYEVTISEESVPFAYAKAELSDDAKAALDAFADFLIKENRDVYIEIQGHTDNIGSEEYNLKLGQARAESVKRHIHTKHNIPLNRMGVFSYGESKPVAENNSRANRAKNRRVVLMVME